MDDRALRIQAVSFAIRYLDVDGDLGSGTRWAELPAKAQVRDLAGDHDGAISLACRERLRHREIWVPVWVHRVATRTRLDRPDAGPPFGEPGRIVQQLPYLFGRRIADGALVEGVHQSLPMVSSSPRTIASSRAGSTRELTGGRPRSISAATYPAPACRLSSVPAICCHVLSDSRSRSLASARSPRLAATSPCRRLILATSVAGKSLGPTGSSAAPRNSASARSGWPARTSASARRSRVAAGLTVAPASRALVSSATAPAGSPQARLISPRSPWTRQ